MTRKDFKPGTYWIVEQAGCYDHIEITTHTQISSLPSDTSGPRYHLDNVKCLCISNKTQSLSGDFYGSIQIYGTKCTLITKNQYQVLVKALGGTQ